MSLQPQKNIEKVVVISQQKTGEASQNPYLSIYRLTLQNTYADGTTSALYPYDAVLRKWLDAVVIILTARIDGQLHICLRSAIRPPLLLRNQCPIPFAEPSPSGVIWELPAGLLEAKDVGEAGILRRACIEIEEETGYVVPMEKISRMRGAPLLTPGTMPERLWYTVAEVTDISDRSDPRGDGSPVEENATIQWVSLERAVGLCEDGAIEDLKTELGIRRMAAWQSKMAAGHGNQSWCNQSGSEK
ncbi:MAG: NUDIX hydrolase [Deltaproteobacteria bacterium]|nr:NUDIX hydrolase [Deltaproteobacteria bacterium]